MVTPWRAAPSRHPRGPRWPPIGRLRAQGLRPIQIWVPDVRSPEFKAEAERQARLVAADRHEAEIMAFIEAAADWGGEA